MTTRDFAAEIAPDASEARLHQIEQILHKFAAETLIKEASQIDDNALHGRINYAHEAAKHCRDKAHEHLNLT